jgi:hypothetical protein
MIEPSFVRNSRVIETYVVLGMGGTGMTAKVVIK